MITPHEYYLSVNGKKIDMDGYYGGQCWDLYAHYMKTLGYKYANCTTSGYVKDIWNNRKTNGMLDSCIEVSVNALQDGDIAVYGNCDACPKSHIGIVRLDNGNGTIVLLGQNQSGQFVDQKTFTKKGIIGVFRPKCYVKTSAKKTNEEIANEVIDGKWGNGKDRKDRLTAAGYDYSAIQAIVNQKVKGTSKKSNEEIADEVIDGKWGNGSERKEKLTKAGYDYNAIQKIVNQKVKGNSSSSSEIKVGDKVTPTSRYSYEGVKLIADVLKHKYTVTEIEGDRVVLGDGLNTAFKKSDLKK